LDLIISVLKPTQVDRASSLRGTGEPSLRNSAKKLDVSSQDVLPRRAQAFTRPQLKCPKRLFIKNTGLCKPVRGGIGADA